MERDNQRGEHELVALIVNILEGGICLNCRQIAERVSVTCQKPEQEGWSDEAIRYHLKELMKQGKVKRQVSGYFIDKGWKMGQPKAFILVEVAKPKIRGENCQKGRR